MSESAQKHPAPRWAWILGTGLGSGCLRPAPGTWGSLSAVLAWVLFTRLAVTPFLDALQSGLGRQAMELGFLALIAMVGVFGTRACTHVVRETRTEDPGFLVVDEWLGMWVTLWPLRWELANAVNHLSGHGPWRLAALLAVPFLIFRVLDITKPWPVFQLQDLPEGQGIMADDLVAGLYGIPVVLLLTPIVLGWLS